MGSAVGGIMITKKGFAALHRLAHKMGFPVGKPGQAQSSIVEQMQAAISLPSSITRAWMQASIKDGINQQSTGWFRMQ